jgi:hypothetical protein
MSKVRITEQGLGRRQGRIEVSLCTVCADDNSGVTTYCLDVSEYPDGNSRECVENDHDCSSVPLDASPKQIAAYLTAAIAAAAGAHSVSGSVRRLASTVDRAGSCAIPGAS